MLYRIMFSSGMSIPLLKSGFTLRFMTLSNPTGREFKFVPNEITLGFVYDKMKCHIVWHRFSHILIVSLNKYNSPSLRTQSSSLGPKFEYKTKVHQGFV